MKKVLFIVTVIILLLVINNLVHSIYDLWHKQDLLTRAEEELVSEQQLNQKLKAELSFAKTNAFIEEEARNKLFMVKPGEEPVLIPGDLLKAYSPAKPAPTIPNWQKWWNLFFK
jgi:cell division protein FtsB